MDTLAERLRTEREKLGWSQQDLAERSGVKQSFVGALEACNQKNSSYLPELARALNVDAYWLKTGKGLRTLDRLLSPDAQTIVEALPLISDDLRESWVEAAKRALSKQSTKGRACG